MTKLNVSNHITNIAIIGAGNMGSALIGGLVNNGHSSNHIWAVDISEEKLTTLKNSYGVQTTQSSTEAVEHAEIVVLATKPQMIKSVVQELLPTLLHKKPLLMSIAAGVRVNSIQHFLGLESEFPIIRVMPNIPALIGCGAAALFANPHVTQEQQNLAENILRTVGIVVWVHDETLMDTVTALSGCGPAYFFMIMQGLQSAAEKLGLSNTAARILTIETALGAAKMAVESNLSFQEMARRVTSPGGATEKGLGVLEENHQLDQLLLKTLQAAKRRAEEISQEN